MEEVQKTVLIIDNSAALRKMVVHALSIFDFKVLEAENVIIAEKLLEKNNVDLILLDWMIPGKNGYEFFIELKENERLCKVPVIMITAERGKDKMLKAVRSGIKYYITKPFTHEDLLARVIQVLKLSI